MEFKSDCWVDSIEVCGVEVWVGGAGIKKHSGHKRAFNLLRVLTMTPGCPFSRPLANRWLQPWLTPQRRLNALLWRRDEKFFGQGSKEESWSKVNKFLPGNYKVSQKKWMIAKWYIGWPIYTVCSCLWYLVHLSRIIQGWFMHQGNNFCLPTVHPSAPTTLTKVTSNPL